MNAYALLLAGILTVAAGAGAAPLPFTATLSFQIAEITGAPLSPPPLVSSGSGVGSFGGAGGSASLPAGVFALNASVPLSPPFLVIDGFGLGAPGQAGPTASPPLSPGSSHALAFDGVAGTMGVDASLYLLSASSGVTNAVLAIPLAVFGVGGTQMFNLLGMTTGTVIGNPYQLGMVTAMGDFFTPATVMGTGFDNRTAGGAGILQLVTPTFFEFEGGAGAIASIATLRIEIVPEPATLLLFGLGLATLGVAARHRRS